MTKHLKDPQNTLDHRGLNILYNNAKGGIFVGPDNAKCLMSLVKTSLHYFKYI